jgi:hypothetical protein
MSAKQLQQLVGRFAANQIDLGEFHANFSRDYLSDEQEPLVEQMIRVIANALADYEMELLSEAEMRIRLSEEILPSSSPYIRLTEMQDATSTSVSPLRFHFAY